MKGGDDSWETEVIDLLYSDCEMTNDTQIKRWGY